MVSGKNRNQIGIPENTGDIFSKFMAGRDALPDTTPENTANRFKILKIPGYGSPVYPSWFHKKAKVPHKEFLQSAFPFYYMRC